MNNVATFKRDLCKHEDAFLTKEDSYREDNIFGYMLAHGHSDPQSGEICRVLISHLTGRISFE
jgi:hypothetical protein